MRKPRKNNPVKFWVILWGDIMDTTNQPAMERIPLPPLPSSLEQKESNVSVRGVTTKLGIFLLSVVSLCFFGKFWVNFTAARVNFIKAGILSESCRTKLGVLAPTVECFSRTMHFKRSFSLNQIMHFSGATIFDVLSDWVGIKSAALLGMVTYYIGARFLVDCQLDRVLDISFMFFGLGAQMTTLSFSHITLLFSGILRLFVSAVFAFIGEISQLGLVVTYFAGEKYKLVGIESFPNWFREKLVTFRGSTNLVFLAVLLMMPNSAFYMGREEEDEDEHPWETDKTPDLTEEEKKEKERIQKRLASDNIHPALLYSFVFCQSCLAFSLVGVMVNQFDILKDAGFSGKSMTIISGAQALGSLTFIVFLQLLFENVWYIYGGAFLSVLCACLNYFAIGNSFERQVLTSFLAGLLRTALLKVQWNCILYGVIEGISSNHGRIIPMIYGLLVCFRPFVDSKISLFETEMHFHIFDKKIGFWISILTAFLSLVIAFVQIFYGKKGKKEVGEEEVPLL
eukprot:GHVP01012685.1.p1 GENE.GHVP01012685.1~~GHVP01012685.1.p1  ORF type:complete len:511 (+),score=74.82 GHVP01012685.1:214-1746(+)